MERISTESDQGDNCSKWEKVEVSEPKAPDLTASISSISSSTTIYDRVRLDVTVKNQGQGASSATKLYYQRLTEDEYQTNNWDDYAYSYPDSTDVVGISAGGSRSYSPSLDPPSTAGTYRFRVCVDKSTESGLARENNCSVWEKVEVYPWAFSLAPANAHPTGITYRGARFYVVDSDDKKVYVYRNNGARDTTKEFDLHSENTIPAGITYGNRRFYVPNRRYGYHGVYEYDSSGSYIGLKFLQDNAGKQGNPTGIAFGNGKFYVVDNYDKKVYWYDEDGGRYEDQDRNPDFSLDNANSVPTGITYSSFTFYVVDSDDKKVYVYNKDGARDTTKEFDLHSNNTNPEGITYRSSVGLYVVDSQDGAVYVYPR